MFTSQGTPGATGRRERGRDPERTSRADTPGLQSCERLSSCPEPVGGEPARLLPPCRKRGWLWAGPRQAGAAWGPRVPLASVCQEETGARCGRTPATRTFPPDQGSAGPSVPSGASLSRGLRFPLRHCLHLDGVHGSCLQEGRPPRPGSPLPDGAQTRGPGQPGPSALEGGGPTPG